MSAEQKRRGSTATAAQERRIIEALRRGPKTTDQLRGLGCYQTSARIHALRHRYGYEITTELFSGVSVDGYRHARMARYTLLSEPAVDAPTRPQSRGGRGLKSGTAGAH